MKVCVVLLCLVALMGVSPVYAVDVTAEVLTIEDVTPMLQEFIMSRPGQKLLKVYGISQPKDTHTAKVFFRYEKRGRPARGELNCFKLNSGKWYCGGVYDYLKK